MSQFFIRFLMATFVLIFAALAYADLPSRSEQLVTGYELDRAKGLKTLSERYIELYSAELKRVLASGNLEEANSIKTKIESLKSEVEQLAAVVNSDMSTTGGDVESLLVGKTIFFRHDRYPDHDSSFIFKKDGEAIWAEAGNASVPRQYKATRKPRQFLLWWPDHDQQPFWEITVAPDGKTATMRNTINNYSSEGRVEKTR